MKTNRIPITKLESNTGQIPGLPMNPRQWTKGDVEGLAKSLLETPELFEARPIIVVPHEGKYVILGGNMRYEASRLNKAADVPCFVLPEDTPVDKMKEIVIKDNGSWGAWDYDSLANEWDDLNLGAWGVPHWEAPAEEPINPPMAGDLKIPNLPQELQGVDLAPGQLEKLTGTDQTAMERIIIVYPSERADALAALLGLDSFDKVVYKDSELPALQ